jgi:hypothetical protein
MITPIGDNTAYGTTNGTGLSGAGTNVLTVPAVTDVELGDLLVLWFGVYNHSTETTTITYPDATWTQLSVTTNGALTVFTAFKYATDAEPVGYDISYTAVRSVVYTIAAYRGVVQDFSNPTVYPYGYFAPGGSLGAVVSGTGASTTQVSGAHPTTIGDAVVVASFYAQVATSAPELDDATPAVAYRDSANGNVAACEYVDSTYMSPVTTVTAVTVRSSVSGQFVVVSLALEPIDSSAISYDTYKAKILRGMWPPPYNNSITSNLGVILTAIGGSDNDIGGLFGSQDFLPSF